MTAAVVAPCNLASAYVIVIVKGSKLKHAWFRLEYKSYVYIHMRICHIYIHAFSPLQDQHLTFFCVKCVHTLHVDITRRVPCSAGVYETRGRQEQGGKVFGAYVDLVHMLIWCICLLLDFHTIQCNGSFMLCFCCLLK
jgi:hypothetical protein